MDCHGAGGGWTFNSLVPDLLDPDCEFVVQEEWTEYTGFLESGLRRRALRRHARDGRRAARRAQPHGLGPGVAEPLVQRHARRRDGDQRRALRHVGLPGAARHRRRGDLRGGNGAARRRADDGRGEGGHRPLSRAADPAAPRARADRGRREAGARRISKAVPPYDPGSPCEVKVEFKRTQPCPPTGFAFHPGVERLDGRTIRVQAPTWWEAWQLFFFDT